MPSLLHHLIKLYIHFTGAKKILSSESLTRKRLEDSYLRPEKYGPPKVKRSSKIIIKRQNHGSWPVYVISVEGRKADKAAIYAHGGAWYATITADHYKFLFTLAEATPLDIIVPIYPLCPRPGANAQQVCEVFAEIVQSSSIPVTTMLGDSAGGQIVLSLVLHLQREKLDSFSAIEKVVLISPALDLTFSHPMLDEILPRDPWLSHHGLALVADIWTGNLNKQDYRVSPLLGLQTSDLQSLPKILLFCGTEDVLYCDALGMKAIMTNAKDKHERIPGSISSERFEFVEGTGLIHVYPLFPCSEGIQARRKIHEFLTS